MTAMVHEKLVALLTPLFPRGAELRVVSTANDDTTVRIEWPGHRGNAANVVLSREDATDWQGAPADAREVEARIRRFVAKRLKTFTPDEHIRVQQWEVWSSPLHELADELDILAPGYSAEWDGPSLVIWKRRDHELRIIRDVPGKFRVSVRKRDQLKFEQFGGGNVVNLDGARAEIVLFAKLAA